MNNITEKNLRLDVHNKEKQILDLYALVDTLQTNLASSVTYLNEEDKKTITNVPSYKWCMNWKVGDEKIK